MSIENNTLFGGFRKAFDLLPAGIQTDVKRHIKLTCEWNSDSTFYAKVRGSRPIKNPEWRVLEEIFASHGIDVHTGQHFKVA